MDVLDRLEQAEQVADGLRVAGNQARFRDINETLEAVSRLHRTEKQSLGSLVFALVGEWARDYESGNYDGRNEATCKRASDMIQGLPEHERGDFWMPYV